MLYIGIQEERETAENTIEKFFDRKINHQFEAKQKTDQYKKSFLIVEDAPEKFPAPERFECFVKVEESDLESMLEGNNINRIVEDAHMRYPAQDIELHQEGDQITVYGMQQQGIGGEPIKAYRWSSKESEFGSAINLLCGEEAVVYDDSSDSLREDISYELTGKHRPEEYTIRIRKCFSAKIKAEICGDRTFMGGIPNFNQGSLIEERDEDGHYLETVDRSTETDEDGHLIGNDIYDALCNAETAEFDPSEFRQDLRTETDEDGRPILGESPAFETDEDGHYLGEISSANDAYDNSTWGTED